MAKRRHKTGRGQNQSGPYSFELRLRVVRMYLEEEYPVPLICKEAGVGRERRQQQAQQQQQQDVQVQKQALLEQYDRAYEACLEGRGYTIR